MKILIVYPEYPKSFWSLNRTIEMFSSKAKFPPKELLHLSVLLPITWQRKFVDMNTSKLSKREMEWADYIFISANEKQHASTIKTIKRCNCIHKKIVACGPLFTEYTEEFENVEHLLLDNIEITLPELIDDLESQKTKKVYHSNPFYEIRRFAESYYSVTSISDKFSRNIKLSYY